MVGDDQRDVAVELAPAPAPEQVEQAVVGLGDHQRDPLALPGRGQAPLHPEAPRDLVEALLETGERVAGDLELDPHEELSALRIGGVLVRGGDVRALLREQLRDRRDDPRPVGARDQQSCARGSGRSFLIDRRDRLGYGRMHGAIRRHRVRVDVLGTHWLTTDISEARQRAQGVGWWGRVRGQRGGRALPGRAPGPRAARRDPEPRAGPGDRSFPPGHEDRSRPRGGVPLRRPRTRESAAPARHPPPRPRAAARQAPARHARGPGRARPPRGRPITHARGPGCARPALGQPAPYRTARISLSKVPMCSTRMSRARSGLRSAIAWSMSSCSCTRANRWGRRSRTRCQMRSERL